MSTLVVVLVVTVVVAVAVLGWIVATYNGLVRRRNGVTNAWSQIEVQLKRRYDLVPNLVETVRGYATHERQTFDSVTAARAAAVAAQGPAEQAKAENALSATLRSLFAVSEAYPQLQASRNFADLAGRAVRHREPHRLLAAVLQRRRPDLQQQRPDRPDQHRRRHRRLHAARVVRGARRGAPPRPGPLLTRR